MIFVFGVVVGQNESHGITEETVVCIFHYFQINKWSRDKATMKIIVCFSPSVPHTVHVLPNECSLYLFIQYSFYINTVGGC